MCKRQPEQFQLAWSLIRESHAHLPQGIQLEEEIAYLSAIRTPMHSGQLTTS
jgi:hypothetical protein